MIHSRRECPPRIGASASVLLCLALSAQALVSQSSPRDAPPKLPAEQAPASAQEAQLPDAPGAPGQGVTVPLPTGPVVILDTSMGRLTCKLFDRQAPLAAANFIGLAEGTKDWTDPATQQKIHGKRFYDGTSFHRVIPGFMIQGGDHLGTGTGDAGYFFDNEIEPTLLFDTAGRLAMANAGPNTNGTQFFVTEAPQPELDGKYTIFGQCDPHSVLIAATIARVERDSNDKPITPVTLNKVSIVRNGQPVPPVPVAAPAAAGNAPATPSPAAAPK